MYRSLQWATGGGGAWLNWGVYLFQWHPNTNGTGLAGQMWLQAQGLHRGGQMRWSTQFSSPLGRWLEEGSRWTCHKSWRDIAKSGIFNDLGSEEGG